jgi:hypothetical protein
MNQHKKTKFVHFVDEELMFSPSHIWINSASIETAEKIRAVHPEIDEIPKIINNYRCKHHPDKIITPKYLEFHAKITLRYLQELFNSNK